MESKGRAAGQCCRLDGILAFSSNPPHPSFRPTPYHPAGGFNAYYVLPTHAQYIPKSFTKRTEILSNTRKYPPDKCPRHVQFMPETLTNHCSKYVRIRASSLPKHNTNMPEQKLRNVPNTCPIPSTYFHKCPRNMLIGRLINYLFCLC